MSAFGVSVRWRGAPASWDESWSVAAIWLGGFDDEVTVLLLVGDA
jgi:hypothetical protein